jgi:hypothetical protein
MSEQRNEQFGTLAFVLEARVYCLRTKKKQVCVPEVQETATKKNYSDTSANEWPC